MQYTTFCDLIIIKIDLFNVEIETRHLQYELYRCGTNNTAFSIIFFILNLNSYFITFCIICLLIIGIMLNKIPRRKHQKPCSAKQVNRLTNDFVCNLITIIVLLHQQIFFFYLNQIQTLIDFKFDHEVIEETHKSSDLIWF